MSNISVLAVLLLMSAATGEICDKMTNVTYYGSIIGGTPICVRIPVQDYKVNFTTSVYQPPEVGILELSIHFCDGKTFDNEIELEMTDTFAFDFKKAVENGICKTADVKEVRLNIYVEKDIGMMQFKVRNNIPKKKSFWSRHYKGVITLWTFFGIFLIVSHCIKVCSRRVRDNDSNNSMGREMHSLDTAYNYL